MEQKKQLSLGNCTKESCSSCDFGYIIKDYIKAIMQCLTNDIPEYHMRLLTSKCLNQSLLISYFMLGKRGIKIADYCDTVSVAKRHNEGKDNNSLLLESMKKDILHKACKYRQLYYILMTDTEFPHDDGINRHFPGHVFIIEKIPGITEPTYYFHQAYINKYDYKGHIKRNNNSLELSWQKTKEMMEQIHYVLLNPTWDENSVKYWKKITFVNTSKMLGAHSQGKMFLCYKKARITDCIGRLQKYIQLKLNDISKLQLSQLDEIYGDKSKYDANQHPLTVKAIKKDLESMQKLIAQNIHK